MGLEVLAIESLKASKFSSTLHRAVLSFVFIIKHHFVANQFYVAHEEQKTRTVFIEDEKLKAQCQELREALNQSRIEREELVRQQEQREQGSKVQQEQLLQENKGLKAKEEQLTQERKSLEAKLVKQQEALAQENQDLRTQLQQENQNLEAKLVKQQEALAQENQGLRAQLQQQSQELRAQLQQEKQSLEAKISKQQEQLEFLMKHLSGLPQPVQPAAVSEEKAPLALGIPLPLAVPILDPQLPLAAEPAPFPAVSLAQNNQHLFAILNLAPAQSHPKDEPTAAPCSP